MHDLIQYEKYLRRRGLLANTRRAYLGVLRKAGEDPVDWYGELLTTRPPMGTIQQARTAIAHWLRMSGTDEATIRGTLAPARGRQIAEKRGLHPGALTAYFDAAQGLSEPLRTILLLLPRTGLRISELCGLKHRNIVEQDDLLILSFHGKGDKHRVVPLGEEGAEVLQEWLAVLNEDSPDEPVFPGRGGPISAWSAQQACRDIRDTNKSLAGLTPHILRHTYATQVVVSGVDLAQLKTLLGHTDIKTTQRYLHPSVDDLAASIGKIKGM